MTVVSLTVGFFPKPVKCRHTPPLRRTNQCSMEREPVEVSVLQECTTPCELLLLYCNEGEHLVVLYRQLKRYCTD